MAKKSSKKKPVITDGADLCRKCKKLYFPGWTHAC